MVDPAGVVQNPDGESLAARRFERLVIVVTLTGLALTGLPQKFAAETWAKTLIILMGGIESTRILHRFLAALLLGEMIYHTLTLSYRLVVLRLRPVMFPGWRDIRDMGRRVLYNLGLTNSPVSLKFVLKIEYLFLVISAIILAITGSILWNPVAVTAVLPGETVPVARSLHSHHALLLIIFIVLWRAGMLLLWHPQRRDMLAERTAPADEDSAEARTRRRQRFLMIAVPLTALVVIGLVWFFTFEQTAIRTLPRREAVIFAPQVTPQTGDAALGEVVWSTLRCGFCHGNDANGGPDGEPALRGTELTYEAFYRQVRARSEKMPAFSLEELPDGYLLHLWTWLTAAPES